MGLTRNDLEKLIKVIKVGNIIKISRGYTSVDLLIISVSCSTNTNRINYKLCSMKDDNWLYDLSVVKGLNPRFMLNDGRCDYFFSLDRHDIDIVEVTDPRTDEILWNNRQVGVETSQNKIKDYPIYCSNYDNVLLDDDRVMAHIFTPKIKGIYANENNRTLVIKWETDEVTKVTCDEEDTFDLENGLARAIAKYVLGNNYNAGTIFNKYLKSIKLAKKKCPVVELVKEKKTQKKTRLHS